MDTAVSSPTRESVDSSSAVHGMGSGLNAHVVLLSAYRRTVQLPTVGCHPLRTWTTQPNMSALGRRVHVRRVRANPLAILRHTLSRQPHCDCHTALRLIECIEPHAPHSPHS